MSHQLAEALRSKGLTLPEYLAQAEARFAEREPAIHAFIPEQARFERLRNETDALLRNWPEPTNRPALYGLLVAVKDIFHAEGFETRGGSRLPAEELQGPQAESLSRLKRAGALVLGKSVTTEFAYFTPGPTRNPHNPEHTPGGSSSGSAAAVAAGLCALALGTQTIGSIIRPASFCGVIGFKPSYDRISREGVIPLAPSLDHIGFFAADLETALDAARVMMVDWNEPDGAPGLPILGVPEGPYLDNVSEEGRLHFERTCEVLSRSYPIRRVPIMHDFPSIRERHNVILSAETAQIHHKWFGKYRDLYSERFCQLIERGRGIAPSQLQTALEAQQRFRAQLMKAMNDSQIDLWISPAAPGPAPKGLQSTGDPVMNLPWTQAGLPALNLPAGYSNERLPMGLQVVANWRQDESLLLWAGSLEKALSRL